MKSTARVLLLSAALFALALAACPVLAADAVPIEDVLAQVDNPVKADAVAVYAVSRSDRGDYFAPVAITDASLAMHRGNRIEPRASWRLHQHRMADATMRWYSRQRMAA